MRPPLIRLAPHLPVQLAASQAGPALQLQHLLGILRHTPPQLPASGQAPTPQLSASR